MNSRLRPTESVKDDGKVKKTYCDKQFKKNLAKALKNIHGEPDNLGKIRSNKHLQNFTEEKITEYVNTLSADVQKNIDFSVKDSVTRDVVNLSNLVNSISEGPKPQEIPMMMKLQAESQDTPDLCATNNVNFRALHRFLYSAVSGLPDVSDLNKETLSILSSTHRMLLEQVDHDATPEFLEEMKSKICAGYQEDTHPEVTELTKVFQQKNMNPFNFPFEYFLNGTLPLTAKEAQQSKIVIIAQENLP